MIRQKNEQRLRTKPVVLADQCSSTDECSDAGRLRCAFGHRRGTDTPAGTRLDDTTFYFARFAATLSSAIWRMQRATGGRCSSLCCAWGGACGFSAAAQSDRALACRGPHPSGSRRVEVRHSGDAVSEDRRIPVAPLGSCGRARCAFNARGALPRRLDVADVRGTVPGEGLGPRSRRCAGGS